MSRLPRHFIRSSLRREKERCSMTGQENLIPVVLFCYNRPDQLGRTLQTLKKNKIPLLYVFCDGPREAKDKPGVMAVHKLVDTITWTKVVSHFHGQNIGLSESFQFGLKRVFRQHRAAIIIEDDINLAPGAYDYMKRALEAYGPRQDIAGVTALRYDFSRRHLDQLQSDVYLTRRFSSWGWGTWRENWQAINFQEINSTLGELDEKQVDFAAGGIDLVHMVHELRAGRLNEAWDVMFYLTMLLRDQYFVWPKYNLVVNDGLQEGTHADSSESWHLSWEGSGQDINDLPDDIALVPAFPPDFIFIW